MGETFEFAIELLGVGMVTVFIILFLVVLVGNLIIAFVNRFFPESIVAKTTPSNRSISTSKTAAIVAAVNIVTSGQGRVVNIEKK
jgi:oxaloacetate decarboxylase gamma subunit